MAGLTNVSSSKYFLYWASLMAGATVVSSLGKGRISPGVAMDRISSDRLDRALNWTLWSTGAVMGSMIELKITRTFFGTVWNNDFLNILQPEHLFVAQATSLLYIFVIKNALPHITKNVPPLLNRMLYGAIGTAVTGAVTSAALQNFTKSYTPWGYRGLAIQALFSLACGLLYSQLGERGFEQSIKDYLNQYLNQLDDMTPLASPLPAFVKEAVAKAPEVFGKQLGEKKHLVAFDTRFRLTVYFARLGLQGAAREKFGLAFARAADVDYRGLAELKVHPMIHFDQIVSVGRTKGLEGNLIIQALSKALAYQGGRHDFMVAPAVPDNACLLNTLPDDIIRQICSHLDPSDVEHWAQTSRRYYHCIGIKGESVWTQRKIDCFRELYNERDKTPELCNALLLAWPDHLLHNIEEFVDLKEGVAILSSDSTAAKKFDDLNNLTQKNWVFLARLMRNNPELFKGNLFWSISSTTNAKAFWTILEQFGLPWEALEPFCAGIKEHKTAIIAIPQLSWKVMQRALRGYPYFVYEKNLFAPDFPDL